MPRYFFNVQDGESSPDLQGTELNYLNAARREAVRFSGSLLIDQPETFWGARVWPLDVCAE